MKDYILRVTANNGAVRGFFATTKNMAQNSFNYHNTSPVVTAAMGRSLTATSIMGLMLKGEKDLVTFKVNGDGPMGGLLCSANSKGDVKGYPFVNFCDIKPKENGKLDVGGALGYGTLTIIKDIGLKNPYSGVMPLISGEIADDLTYYYAKSEQIPTTVGLGVLVGQDGVEASGGFLIQLLPSNEDNTALIEKIEKTLIDLPPISTMLKEGKTPYDISKMFFDTIDSVEEIEVSYKCDCNIQRVTRAVVSLGKEEVFDIIDEKGEVSINCNFCNKSYSFSKEQCEKLF